MQGVVYSSCSSSPSPHVQIVRLLLGCVSLGLIPCCLLLLLDLVLLAITVAAVLVLLASSRQPMRERMIWGLRLAMSKMEILALDKAVELMCALGNLKKGAC